MRLLSVNVGLPAYVDTQGPRVRTSIWKYPVQGRVRVATLNLDGDRQSDLSVHGGVRKAVYVYPGEHYEYWRQQLGLTALDPAAFGENFTTEGLVEGGVRIGDRLAIGTAEFLVTQPRQPCYKLAIRFGREDMVRRFAKSGRSGFYLAVTTEGEVGAGDAITFIGRHEQGMTVADDFSERMRDRFDS